MNLWDILILLAVAAAVLLALRALRGKKGACSCGCADCPGKQCCARPEKADGESKKQ